MSTIKEDLMEASVRGFVAKLTKFLESGNACLGEVITEAKITNTVATGQRMSQIRAKTSTHRWPMYHHGSIHLHLKGKYSLEQVAEMRFNAAKSGISYVFEATVNHHSVNTGRRAQGKIKFNELDKTIRTAVHRIRSKYEEYVKSEDERQRNIQIGAKLKELSVQEVENMNLSSDIVDNSGYGYNRRAGYFVLREGGSLPTGGALQFTGVDVEDLDKMTAVPKELVINEMRVELSSERDLKKAIKIANKCDEMLRSIEKKGE
jgi:hypothetical protein